MNEKDEAYWRTKGEQDRAENKGYHKPHGILSALITWSVAGLRKQRKENEAYRLGWTYTIDRNSDR